MSDKVDRSELAIWAEGTRYTPDELANMYLDYRTIEQEEKREPLAEGAWANEILGIPNESETWPADQWLEGCDVAGTYGVKATSTDDELRAIEARIIEDARESENVDNVEDVTGVFEYVKEIRENLQSK